MNKRFVWLTIVFCLVAFCTVYLDVSVLIPGTDIVIVPHEIINIIGAAIFGPVGGICIAISSVIYPFDSLQLYRLLIHILGALWIAFYTRKALPRISINAVFIVLWFVGIQIYFLVIPSIGLFTVYSFFPGIYALLGNTDISFQQNLGTILGALFPEALFTFFYTILIYWALPVHFFPDRAKRSFIFGRFFEKNASQQTVHKRFLAIRLSLWFIILISIPALYLGLILRNYYLENLMQTASVSRYPILLELSKEFKQKSNAEFYQMVDDENIFGKNISVYNPSGARLYPDSTSEQTKDIPKQLTAEECTRLKNTELMFFINNKNKYAVCYTTLAETGNFICSIIPASMYEINMGLLQSRITFYLGLTIILVSVFTGGILWVVIGVPMKRFTEISEQIAGQNYEVDLDLSRMSDELYILGDALVKMKDNIVEAQLELREQELKYRTIYSAANDAIILLKNGIIVDCNDAAAKMFGDRVETIIGKSPAYYSPELQPDGLNSFQKVKYVHDAVMRGEEVILEWVHQRTDGVVFFTEVKTHTLKLHGEIFVQAIVRDINDRKLVENELRKNELKFRSLISSMQEFVITADSNLYITGVYGQWSETYGFSESLIGMNYSTLYRYQNEVEKALTSARKALEGERQLFEWHLERDATLFYFESSLAPLFDTDDSVIGLVCVARDITDRKQAERTLYESEERYKSLFNNLPDTVIVHRHGKLLFANQAAAVLFGAESIDALIGHDILQFIHPDFVEVIKSRIAEAFSNNTTLPVTEIKVRKFNGTFIDVEVYGTTINYSGMRVMQSIIRDVSRINQVNFELQKLGKAVEQSPSGILITNKYGIIEYVNRRFIESSGYTMEDLIGKTPRIFKSGYHGAAYYKEFWDKILSGEEWHGEIRNRKKSGELYWEMNHISALKNSDGQITHFIAMKEDVTPLKKLAEELMVAKTEAEEASRLKSTLMANMSHEFRTPLNGILGFSQILLEELIDNELKRFALKIAKSGKRLMDTLNSVLIVSELETSEFVIQNKKTSVSSILHRIHYQYDILAMEKNISLQSENSANNDVFFSDEEILLKILSFIVDNGIKYTSEGNVKVVGELHPHTADRKILIFTVTDSGIGIKHDDLPNIFREFKQASEGFSRAYEGLGLGLSIAKRLTTLMQGTITVQSEIGKGSTFTIEIPVT